MHQVSYDFTIRHHGCLTYNFWSLSDYLVLFFCFRCQPLLSKLYFVWVIPSGNDFEVSCNGLDPAPMIRYSTVLFIIVISKKVYYRPICVMIHDRQSVIY